MASVTRVATRGAVVTAAAAAAAVAVRRLRGRRFGIWVRRPRRGSRRPWHTATVYCPPDRVAPDGRLPEPLARLADTVEVRIRPAPGGRGTELAVRPRDGRPSLLVRIVEGIRGRDGRYAVRTALRETKQLLETGEVLRPDRPPTSRSTLLNRPVRTAVRLGREGGRL